MNEFESNLQELGENLDLSDVTQIKMFSDILSETNYKGKMEKTCKLTNYLIQQWKIKENDLKNNEATKLKDQQIYRLISHLQYFVSLFEAFSFKTELFQLFLTSKNFENSIKLIPQTYFSEQAENLENFIKNEKIKNQKIKTNLSDYSIDNLPKKIEELKVLKSETENSNQIENVKNGFREICALFELTLLFNNLLIQRISSPNIFLNSLKNDEQINSFKNQIKQKTDENSNLKLEIEQLKQDLLEKQRTLNNYKRSGIEKLQTKLENAQNQIEKLEKELSSALVISAQNETIKTENIRLQSDLETLTSQCNRLLNVMQAKKEQNSKWRKIANSISGKYIKIKEEYNAYKEEQESKYQNEVNKRKELIKKLFYLLNIPNVSINYEIENQIVINSISNEINKLKEQLNNLIKKEQEKSKSPNDFKNDESILYYRPSLSPQYTKTHAELDRTIRDLQNFKLSYPK